MSRLSNILPLGLLLLAACGSEETIVGPDPDDGGDVAKELPIALAGRNVSPMVVSRTTTPLHTIYENFTAWGYKNLSDGVHEMMHGYTVKYYVDTNNRPYQETVLNQWDYYYEGAEEAFQGVKYWDMDAEDYRLFGVAPKTEHSLDLPDPVRPLTLCPGCKTDNTYREARLATNAVTSESNIPYYSELYYTNNTEEGKKYGQPVTLEFQRPWARVRFVFEYPSGVAYGSFSLTNISFGPNPRSATDRDIYIPTNVDGGIPVHYPIHGEDHKAHVAWPNLEGYYQVLVDANNLPTTMSCPYEDEGEEKDQHGDAIYNHYTLPGHHASDKAKWYYVLPTADIAKYYGNTETVTDGEWSFDAAKSPFAPREYLMTVYINGTQKGAVVPVKELCWEANKQYTYVFTITPDAGISLAYTLETIMPWQAGVSQSVTW